MDIKEFKILLKLLQKKDYKSPPGELNPSKATKIAETKNFCRRLCSRNFVELIEEIEEIGITSTGKTLLKQKKRPQALTEKEWKVLQFFLKTKTLKPADIKIKSLKASQRNEIITNAVKRDFLKVNKYRMAYVTLTPAGQDFIATEYLPTAGNITMSCKMLEYYLRFMRQYWQKKQGKSEDLKSRKKLIKPTDKKVLQTIIDLDKELNTDNYLPIFHLRNKLQPPLTRDQLDQALYRLQKQDILSMSSLVDSSQYSLEEYKTGIPQLDGGPLFYLIVK